MSKGSDSKAALGSSQARKTPGTPKGTKRSAAEAFTSKPQSVSDTLDAHRRHVGNRLSGNKTVVFHGSGETKHEVAASPQHKTKPNLKQHARDLLPVRRQLPIYKYADQIRQTVQEHDVLLLVGETGSGKSTQIPQFLVTESWCQKKTIKGGASVGGCIAITQPRRVAAISLARRVAEEIGTPLGNASPASQVGYSVRFENSTSPSTKIKFLTEGMLLQEMLRDPWLKEYSAVVVDEVHERGVNVDLVLGFLRRLQDLKKEDDGRGGIGMKVVIMSATADMEKIGDFFNSTRSETPAIERKDNVGEDWAGFSDGGVEHTRKNASDTTTNGTPHGSAPNKRTKTLSSATSLFIKGRQHPVSINYAPSPVPDILDAAYQRIMHIHSHTSLPGDILVFLTGQETVESLLSLVNSWSVSIQKDAALSKTLPKLLILPLYAALPSSMQQRVFQATPKFTRKIILATNIAETSITVPGIRYVIDTGKAKQRLFRPSLNLDTLLTVPISRSSANQRSGRAGRDAPGTAYRLYTESDFYQLAQDTEPEILRCDLSQLVLTLKAHSIDDLQAFPFLTRPPRRALERAMIHLLQLSALDPSTGQITPLGREMSVLPLPASLARVLLASTDPQFDCTDEIIDIVSALSVENIFLNTHQNRNNNNTPTAANPLALKSKPSETENPDSETEHDSRASLVAQARRALYRREGDHLTLLATMQAYGAEPTDRHRWCDDRAISHRAMTGAMDVRKQLTSLMQRRQRQHNPKPKRKSTDIDDHDKKHDDKDPSTLPSRILKCILTGFHPNVARLSADGTYRTILTNQPVAIHPSSVLFSPPVAPGSSDAGGGAPLRKFEAIMYNEFVYTGTKAYARGVSAVEMGWVGEVLRTAI